MLLALTDTALQRRWSPAVYSRLSVQLGASAGTAEQACETLLKIVESTDEDALLFDYIYHATLEQVSIFGMYELISHWGSQPREAWTCQSRNLIIFVARGISAWKPSSDVALKVTEVLPQLITQASQEREEVLFFISQLVLKGPLCQLSKASSTWRTAFELQVCEASKNCNNSIMNRLWTAMLQQFDLSRPAREESSLPDKRFTPSRTSRLFWLDYTVCNILYIGDDALRSQIEILWPNERLSALVFELTLTAFDAMASTLSQKSNITSLWASFICKKLPLVFQSMITQNADESTKLDAAFIRLLTTMDKDVATALDQYTVAESNDPVRVAFCKACIDLELCDTAVLHILHQDYKPQPANADTILSVPIAQLARKILQQDPDHVGAQASLTFQFLAQFPKLTPLVQQSVAREFLKVVVTPGPTVLKHAARICVALLSRPTVTDQLLMHIPARLFLNCLAARVEDVVNINASSPSTYSDCGAIAMLLAQCMRRYGIGLKTFNSPPSIILIYADRCAGSGLSSPVQLSASQSEHLGRWICGITGSQGISDDMLISPSDFLIVYPELIRQSLTAHQLEVLNFEQLKGMIDYITQPFLISAIVLPFSVFRQNLWMKKDVSATEKALKLVLDSLSSMSSRPELPGVMAGICPLLKDIKKLLENSSLIALVDKHIEPYAVWYAELQIPSGSLVQHVSESVSALAQWQKLPAGIPQPSRSLFWYAKASFGQAKLRKVIEQCLDNSEVDTEVLFAILLIHGSGLFSCRLDFSPLMIDCPGRVSVTETVRAYVEKFKQAYADSVKLESNINFGSPIDSSLGYAPVPPPPAQPSYDFGRNETDLDLDISMPGELDEIDNAINFDMWE